MTLEGKKAILTGGSLGIGAEIARELGRQGARVAINYRKHDTEAKQVIADIEAAGSKGLAIKADVASFDDAQRMVDEVREKFGGLDILVNNAGITYSGTLEETATEDWDRCMAVNARGPFLLCREALPLLREARPGYVVNVSSVVGVSPQAPIATP